MNILIDVGHPAHVHYFRHLAEEFIQNDSEVLFTTRDKEEVIRLLDHYGFKYVNFGRPFRSRFGKIFGLFWFTLRLLFSAFRFKPDIYLNATPYSAIAAWLLRKPHVSLEDTFNMEQVGLYLPFTDVVLTGSYSHPALGSKEIQYNGYQELCYLHPRRFTPDPEVLKEIKVHPDEKYIVLRFISWGASHDFGSKGISNSEKERILSELKKYGRVFISAEAELPESFKPYQLRIPPHRIHDALAFSSLYVGEGATMASECAMLGTPSIHINPQERFYIKDQELNYGVIYSFRDFSGVLEKALELIQKPDQKKIHQERARKMVSQKIDVSGFLIWFVRNYPQSKDIIKKDPAYQNRFK